VKPASWPQRMKEKRVAGDAVAYYWSPHIRDIRDGCPVRPEPLGRDYAAAVARATLLNLHLKAWRTGRNTDLLPQERPTYGTLCWLFGTYLNSKSFQNRVSKRSQYEYRRALRRIEDTPTKTGGTVGGLPVSSITPAAVDKIYTKLQMGPRGKRIRQANLSIDIARRAWKVVRRSHSHIVPLDNPWAGVEKDLRRTPKAAATRNEAYALARKLIEIGEPHLGAAALICFEWHQRPEHVLCGDITWQDYRPPQRPDAVFVRHPKTGEKGWLPLEDETGNLYPEIESALAALPRLGIPIVLTAGRRGPARPYSSEYSSRRVREARKLAGLGSHVTLDTCRHGGLTELGDSGATEAETMAASMHKTPSAARLYVKRTEAQRIAGARKRRTLVENISGRSGGMEQQTKRGNDEK
jgi:hypothetical protein